MEPTMDVRHIPSVSNALRFHESTYAKNPNDADNLTTWGGFLFELSQVQEGPESKMILQDAIVKLKEALVVNPRKHDALWGLGLAYSANAFLIPDLDEARGHFDKSNQYFEQACELEPQSSAYRHSLEVAYKIHKRDLAQRAMGPGPSASTSRKDPELHVEIRKHGLAPQAMGPGPSASTSTKQQGTKKSKSSDLKLGWIIILAVGIVAWGVFAKSNLSPPPPR